VNQFGKIKFDSSVAAPDSGQPRLASPAAPARSSLFNSELWHKVLEQTYGFHIMSASLPSRHGESQMLKYVEINDFRGRRLISLPFCDFCDPQVSDATAWTSIASQLMEQGCPIRLKTVHNDVVRGDGRFEASVSDLWHAIDISADQEMIWNSIKPVARSRIRYAQKHGVEVTIGDSVAEVMEFFAMHAHVRRTKYQLLAQPEDFFTNIQSVFGSTGDLHVAIARLSGEPIAGTLYIRHGDTLYYKFNASVRTDLRPNDLLVWHGIQLGKRLGLRWLDFGISALDQPGLIFFKEKFATEQREVTQLKWMPPAYANTAGAEAGRVLGELTSLLTSDLCSPEAGRRAGNLLYRYFC
jgi:Acetyltransferase (GNAT) domain